MNILSAKIDKAGKNTEVTHSGGKRVRVPIATPAGTERDAVSFGVRPEDLFVAKGKDFLFEGMIDYIEQLGEVQLVYVDIGRGLEEPLIAKLPGNANVKRGTTIKLDANGEDLHIFNSDGRSLSRSVHRLRQKPREPTVRRGAGISG